MMLERRRYQEHPDRYEYLPTAKAVDLVPALMALVAWGDRWTARDGPPMLFSHRACGQDTVAAVVARPVRSNSRDDIHIRPGTAVPGPAPAGHRRPPPPM